MQKLLIISFLLITFSACSDAVVDYEKVNKMHDSTIILMRDSAKLYVDSLGKYGPTKINDTCRFNYYQRCIERDSNIIAEFQMQQEENKKNIKESDNFNSWWVGVVAGVVVLIFCFVLLILYLNGNLKEINWWYLIGGGILGLVLFIISLPKIL